VNSVVGKNDLNKESKSAVTGSIKFGEDSVNAGVLAK
jgi:hypothetical protein